jgi:hypothetical protein
VDDKEHRARADHPKSDPPLLLGYRFITLCQSARIVEDENGGFEANSMFA